MEIRFGMEHRDLIDKINNKDSVTYRHGRGVIEVTAPVISDNILDRPYVQLLDDTVVDISTQDGEGEEIVRCQGITADGEQCERNVDVGDGSPPYCYQHIDQA